MAERGGVLGGHPPFLTPARVSRAGKSQVRVRMKAEAGERTGCFGETAILLAKNAITSWGISGTLTRLTGDGDATFSSAAYL